MWNKIKYYESPSHYKCINNTVTLAHVFFLIVISEKIYIF